MAAVAEMTFRRLVAGRESNLPDWPVEIRTPDFRLVGRWPTSSRVEVSPGSYLVAITPPGHEPVEEWVDVTAGEGREVVLDLPPNICPRERRTVMADIEPPNGFACRFRIADLAEELHGLARPEEVMMPRLRLYWQSGNWFTSAFHAEPDPDLFFGMPFLNRWEQRGGEESTKFLQVRRAERPLFTVALPADASAMAKVSFALRRNGEIGCEVGASDPQAEFLIGCMRRGEIGEAATCAEGKREGIAAIASGYILLRAGRLEAQSIHEPSADALLIEAETHARRGQHAEACRLFLHLPEYGLPIFADGLSFAIERLSLYLDPSLETVLDLTPEERSIGRSLRAELRLIAACADFGEPLLTVYGADLAFLRPRLPSPLTTMVG